MFSETARQSASLARRARTLAARIEDLLTHVNAPVPQIRVEGKGVRGLRFFLRSVDMDTLTGTIEAEDGTQAQESLLKLEIAPVSQAWLDARANAAFRAAEKAGKEGGANDALTASVLAALRGEVTATAEDVPLTPEQAALAGNLSSYLAEEEVPAPLPTDDNPGGKRNRRN